MTGTMNIIIRTMSADDYDNVYELWMSIKGFGIRSLDDSRAGVERFLRRNPDTCVVAEQNGRIVGTILCGHDGRRACLYHVCVAADYRKHGVGNKMVGFALEALKLEGINKVNLVAFKDNKTGNAFWSGLGWNAREDVNYYECTLNEDNITEFI